DTNPIDEKREYVDAFKNDLEWLKIRYDGEYYASDSIEEVYRYGELAIESGNAYACWCSKEKMSNDRWNSVECEHRSIPAPESLSIFKDMAYKKTEREGAAIRLKLDMESQNTAMRDPIIFRRVNYPHYRHGDKYRLWPKYEFNTPIMDSIHGITHAIRSKEYELRDEMYDVVLDILSLRKPVLHS
ncbi:glutaminyl-tRNA synthetase, partial [mine drainage metagenome]